MKFSFGRSANYTHVKKSDSETESIKKKRTHAHAPRGPHAGIPNFENGILVYMLVLPGKFSTTALYSCSTKAVQAT